MYDTPVDWKSLLKDADWHEFEHSGGKYRATPYKLDGGDFIAVHKFVGIEECPIGHGWAGYQWCLANDKHANWPGKEIAQNAIDEKGNIQEPLPQSQPIESKIVPDRNLIINGIPIAPDGERRY